MPSSEELRLALATGFIDQSISSNELLQPTLLLNDRENGKKVLSTLIGHLERCDEFWLYAAFLTRSGIKCLQNTLRELESRNVNGKVLVSQYLNFTQPIALRDLSKFSNVQGRLINTSDYHGKGYLFRCGERYHLIIGSSNLTADALCKNAELNLKISAQKNSKVIGQVKSAFEHLFATALPLTPELISQYEDVFEKNSESIHRAGTLVSWTEAALFRPNSMQIEALDNLEAQRSEGKNKSLVISATGTGKTALAAFDVKSTNAEKMLFVVHRGNIARKAMETFQSVFGTSKSVGLYSGAAREMNADFVFCTVQTINNERHLHNFKKDHFDYIIIDETHRAGATTYQKVLDYFNPKFLLGMTATPERTDGFDIFSLFNHNIGYEIRLHRAMEENLLCQFHYFGVADISVDGQALDEVSDFNLLVAGERVDRIVEVAEDYGCDDDNVRGLIFCSKVEEAEALSKLLNQRGYQTVALSGKSSEDERKRAIIRLESDSKSEKLDYILTVDIFNEGIDIPRLNQIIMLRPTQSAIVFVQQLGRGLRRIEGKEYLTVIDFIGNYDNNYMIPIALYGDSSFNKDTIRKLLAAGSALIPGSSTVNFEKIAKDRIFQSVDAANLNKKRDLVQDYRLLKYRLGRIPMMTDFVSAELRDPFQFVEYSKSYLNFVKMVEDETALHLLPVGLKLLEYISKNINDGKRVEESLVLKYLLTSESVGISELKSFCVRQYGFTLDEKILKSVANNINLRFVTELSSGKRIPVGDIHGYELLQVSQESLVRGKTLAESLKEDLFKEFLTDSVEFSIQRFNSGYNPGEFVSGFQRYQKYSRKDVFRILSWSQNPIGLNVGGYKVSPDKSNCPIFLNYEKEEGISDTTKYEDHFNDQSTVTYMSKNKRTLKSPEVILMRNQKSNGIRLPLFVKKSNAESTEHYFIGDLTPVEDSFSEDMMPVGSGPDVSVVKMVFSLDKAVEDNVYKYLTGAD
jgi:superfamily II DNA or RNA helicase/HKD family nuclease